MSADNEYLKYAILFIDDEEQSQKYFSQIFGRIFKIYLASDGEEGLKLFHEHREEIGIVVSDQRMPGISGSDLLAQIAESSPNIVNILSTAYSDLEAAIDAVNQGGIYRYVTKPWDLAELEVTLRRAMDYFQLKEQHRSLAEMKIAGLEQMFHQSRLLACMAIPALLENDSSFIRAFRDLLRLSLKQDGRDSQGRSCAIEMLTQKERAELSERLKEQLAQLLQLVRNREDTSSEDLDKINKQLGECDSDSQRLVGVHALFQLLEGKGTEADLALLAQLLNAYRSGYEIEVGADGPELALTDPEVPASTVIKELYDLFVDDAYLTSLVLGDLS